MMKKILDRSTYLYVASFAIPLVIVSVVFALLGVYPFGDKLFLVHDMNGQYISFFTYLKDMAANGNNFFYSFSQVFGLDLVGVTSYYLLSPFNILVFLIRNTELAMILIIMLKIATSGLTFFTFLSKNSTPSIQNIAFSSMYALSAYNLVYSHNLMWLDGVVFLPLIALGIDILFRNSKPWVYLISLGFGIFANYYIGYMLCLFSVLYFIGKMVMRFEHVKELKSVLIKYIVSSLCAGLTNAVTILPTAALLVGGKTQIATSEYAKMPLDDFLTKIFTGSYDLGQQHYGANIYCTVVAVVLLITYFFNKRISTREKIFSGVSLGLLILSLTDPKIQSIWHMFNQTEGFPNRHAFITCFVIVYFAYRSFARRDGIPFYGYIAAGGIFSAISIFLLIREEYTHLPKSMVTLSLIFAVLTSVFLSVKKENLHRYVAIGLIALVYGDLCVNAYRTLSQFEFVDSQEYYSYASEMTDVVDKVEESDDGFYRMEKTFLRKFENRGWSEFDRNDPMRFGYNGLTCFHSSQKQFIKDLCEDMGFTTFLQWSCYQDGLTRSADVLFGLKYIMDKEKRFEGVYQPVLTSGDITVYQNPLPLSVIFSADEAIDSTSVANLNPFEIQNTFFKTILGYGEDILTKQEYTVNAVNFTQQPDGVTWKKTNKDEDGYIEYKMVVKDRGPIYAFFPSEEKQYVHIEINGEADGRYFDHFRHNMLSLGSHQVGDEIVIKFRPGGDMVKIDNAFFYSENLDYLIAYAKTIGAGNAQLTQHSSSHLSGTVTVQEGHERLMMTVPYQKGWSIYIDGEKTEYTSAFDNFISIPATVGEHKIELKYTPPLFVLGLIISIISILSAIIAAFHKQMIVKLNSWRLSK